jgi:glycosyltransferase involved in cell wall biosynthesis
MFAHADATKLRAQFAIGARPVVMYTGINNAFQRVDHLLRAFRVVLDEEPNAVLMIVSPITNEPNRPVNEALAHELGLAASVIWAGPHELRELPDYLALADVCVVPRCECPGHPIKLLNYMIAEKPIVCFAGAAKGITHLHEAWIVPDHDCNQLGHGILKLLRDRALAARLAANGRTTAIRDFDWRNLSQKVEAIYERILSKRDA